ncbi:MAG: 3-oxoacyl-ACP reductase FabG [Clostridiales bacterium]|nr:3-oxoacyl-ACP reductase FabG [Clostridiales bacterium]
MFGKVVLITGGSRGIGRAIVRKFSQAGCSVHFCYKNSENEANSLASEIVRSGGVAVAYRCDVTDREQVERMTGEVLSSAGQIDVLINNAGIASAGLFCDLCESDWNRIFDVNVKGVFNVTQAVMGDMVRRKQGSIINIASVWGEVGASCEVAYSASKAAVIGFTKALAKELGPSGVRVNCITPGVIETDMLGGLGVADLSALAEMTALCRIGQPDEIASVALFLSGEGASFITGQVLGVNGGFPL